MMSLRQLSAPSPTVPAATAWLVGDLGVALGRQELFTRQSPQRLKVLRVHAIVESAVSSNRIEGVEVDEKRVATLIFGSPSLRDRDEEEVRGYRTALDLIYLEAADLERLCPGVGRDWIRKILRKMKADGEMKSTGHGAGARWERANKGTDTLK